MALQRETEGMTSRFICPLGFLGGDSVRSGIPLGRSGIPEHPRPIRNQYFMLEFFMALEGELRLHRETEKYDCASHKMTRSVQGGSTVRRLCDEQRR